MEQKKKGRKRITDNNFGRARRKMKKRRKKRKESKLKKNK